MPKLIFRAALIRFVDLRYDDKAKQKYVKINFTAAFSEPVREAMEWGEPPAGFASAKLDGDLTASHFILTPDGKAHDTSEAEDGPEPEKEPPLARAGAMGGTHQKRQPRGDRGTVN